MSKELSPQCTRILKLLEWGDKYYPEGYVQALDLAYISLSFTRRIHELRAAGHEIELEDKWNGRQRRTRYRLIRKANAA